MDMEERLDALEDAMWHASEMVEALKRIGGYEDMIGALEGTIDELQYAADEAEKEVSAAQERERREEERDYWRSVI